MHEFLALTLKFNCCEENSDLVKGAFYFFISHSKVWQNILHEALKRVVSLEMLRDK